MQDLEGWRLTIVFKWDSQNAEVKNANGKKTPTYKTSKEKTLNRTKTLNVKNATHELAYVSQWCNL
jgi:hypothetical protein